MKLDHIVEEEIAPVHEELTALPKWDSVYNPHRTLHTRHGSEDPVLIKDIFSKETIDALGRGSRSRASSLVEDDDNPRHSRMMIWLVLCLATLLILAIVLGAVLGTFLNPGQNSSPSTSVTEIPAESGQQSPPSVPTIHIASLAATGWQVDGSQGYFVTWLFWQNSKGFLSRATFNSSTGNWTRVTNFAEAQVGTPMTAASFSSDFYKGQPHYDLAESQFQSMVVFRDSASCLDRINAWVFQQDGPVTGQSGSLNKQKYMSHASSKITAYWPRILYQGMSGEVREARFECYEDNECWNDDVLTTTQPLNGTGLTMIPMQNDLSSYAMFYQEEDGRCLTYLEGANESSTIYGNQAFSDRVPLNASVAAFSTTRKGDDSSLNAYLLWQDEKGVVQMSWADDYSGWKGPISYAAFAGAENGTALTCITGQTFRGFPLPAGSELARCYFQTGAAVREVSFDGASWDVTPPASDDRVGLARLKTAAAHPNWLVEVSSATATSTSAAETSTPPQGALDSAGAGITGGYTGDSLSLKIIIAFLLGLSLYNAVELLVLVLVTFNRYRGLYFWSLIVAGIGIIPYALGFLIKFFQLLDPNANECYVGVVLLTVGWYMMVTGQSVVLWSRLHLLTNSRRVLRWTLYMIVTNACVLHATTSVLTFGSNSNGLTNRTLMHFVNGYSVMEKIQMVGFFVQELILSLIYIKETVRLLKLAEAVKSDLGSFDGGADPEGHLRHGHVRKTMYQLLAINAIIISMDIALLAVEFANLYLIETTLKGVIYSIKLKLEFSVLGKLVQLVQGHSDSQQSYHSPRGVSTGLELDKPVSGGTSASRRIASATDSLVNSTTDGHRNSMTISNGRLGSFHHFPDFVNPHRIEGDITHANELAVPPAARLERVGSRDAETDRWRRRSVKLHKGSWIDEEMDKHNIG